MSLHLIPAPDPAPGPAPVVVDGDPGVVVCLACGLDFDHFTEPGEPGYFAAVHNGLHHRGNPVAFVTDVDASALGGEAA
jgi:hypothetical protein